MSSWSHGVRLCDNCESGRHIECCLNCTALVPTRRRDTGFCTKGCETEQREREAQRAQELATKEDD